MDINIAVNGLCAGGNHVLLTATVDGKSKDFHMNKADFQIEPDEYEDIIAILLRSFYKEQGFTNQTPISEVKTAIESKVFKL